MTPGAAAAVLRSRASFLRRGIVTQADEAAPMPLPMMPAKAPRIPVDAKATASADVLPVGIVVGPQPQDGGRTKTQDGTNEQSPGRVATTAVLEQPEVRQDHVSGKRLRDRARLEAAESQRVTVKSEEMGLDLRGIPQGIAHSSADAKIPKRAT